MSVVDDNKGHMEANRGRVDDTIASWKLLVALSPPMSRVKVTQRANKLTRLRIPLPPRDVAATGGASTGPGRALYLNRYLKNAAYEGKPSRQKRIFLPWSNPRAT